MPEYKIQLDVRDLPPKDRLGTIYAAFDSLKPGERMELINDHDPNHLHQRLETDKDGQFDWKYLLEGPAEWRILISKM